MKTEDVIKEIVRIVRDIEKCAWIKDNGQECSNECPLWNMEACCEDLRNMDEVNFQRYTKNVMNLY